MSLVKNFQQTRKKGQKLLQRFAERNPNQADTIHFWHNKQKPKLATELLKVENAINFLEQQTKLKHVHLRSVQKGQLQLICVDQSHSVHVNF